MTSKMSLIVRKLTGTIETMFSSISNKRRKIVVVEKNQNRNLIATLSKCDCCEGTGSVRSKGKIEEHLPSRFGILNTTQMTTCPLCNGTGYIKKSPNEAL